MPLGPLWNRPKPAFGDEIKTTHGFLLPGKIPEVSPPWFFGAQARCPNQKKKYSNKLLVCSFLFLFSRVCSISFNVFIKVLQFPCLGTFKPEKIQRKLAVPKATLMKPTGFLTAQSLLEPYTPASATTMQGTTYSSASCVWTNKHWLGGLRLLKNPPHKCVCVHMIADAHRHDRTGVHTDVHTDVRTWSHMGMHTVRAGVPYK